MESQQPVPQYIPQYFPQEEQTSQPQQYSAPSGEDPTNLIVNYVPTPVTDAQLRQLFEQFGELESVRVILDKVTQHPKGYGFVKYRRVEDATLAVERMNGFEICNKRLKVTIAKGPHNPAMSAGDNGPQLQTTGMSSYVTHPHTVEVCSRIIHKQHFERVVASDQRR